MKEEEIEAGKEEHREERDKKEKPLIILNQHSISDLGL